MSLVLKNGVEVKIQRNALSVLEAPTGNEEEDDDDMDCDNSFCTSSDMGDKDMDYSSVEFQIPTKPRVRHTRPWTSSARSNGRSRDGQFHSHNPQLRVNLVKLETTTLWRYWKHFNLVSINPNPLKEQLVHLVQHYFVSQVTRPVAFPYFGVLKKEKHVLLPSVADVVIDVLLPSVADVVIEQGYLQSLFGIYSVRIENAGVRKPASDDVQIQGIAHSKDFRKAVIMRLSNMNVSSSRQALINEDPLSLGSALPPMQMTPSRSLRRYLLPSSGELI